MLAIARSDGTAALLDARTLEPVGDSVPRDGHG